MKKAIGAIKDNTTISLARVGSKAVFSNLQVAIVRATRHEENPPGQHYVSEILSLTGNSHTLISACVDMIADRLNKTKNWVVALKALMLVQHLLSQDGQAFEMEIFFSTRKGTNLLNMRDFRDSSSKSNAWDYSSFVRTYAMYLDERLEFRMQGYKGKDMYHGEEEKEDKGGAAAANEVVTKATLVSEMKTVAVFSRVHLLMQILDRFLACKPTGAAKDNRVVAVALYPIVKESVQLFHDITEILGILIDRFMQLEVIDMMKIYEIFSRISKQFDELDCFYEWCKMVRITRFSELPDVKQIPQSKLDMMDDFIRQKAATSQKRIRSNRKETRKAEAENALPPQPERFIKPTKYSKEKKEEVKETKEVGNLLDFSDEDASCQEEQGDKLALALFDSYTPITTPASTSTPWEAFKDSSGDWEMALVQSVRHFSNQKPSFDTSTLNGMYQQSASGSSVARRSNVLALPVPAPYVQMPEIEIKQKLLVEEQLMWQQGVQGQVGIAKVQYQNSYQYIPGGYTQTW